MNDEATVVAGEAGGSKPRLPNSEDWVKRLQTVGKAQERYLWVMVILALFFAALHARMVSGSEPDPSPITLPILGLELEARVIWAFGPILLSFILLAFFGALRAFDSASSQLGLDKDGVPPGSLEGLDIAPNALDFAVYTTASSHPLLQKILYLTYPVVTLAVLFEAAWIGWVVFDTSPLVSWSSAFVLVALPLWVGAAYQGIVLHLLGRITKLRDGGRLK